MKDPLEGRPARPISCHEPQLLKPSSKCRWRYKLDVTGALFSSNLDALVLVEIDLKINLYARYDGARAYFSTPSLVRILTMPLSFQWACCVVAPIPLGTCTSRSTNS